MMGWQCLLLLLVGVCHQASSFKPPSKEHMCGLIVDSSFQQACLDCFTAAGSLSVNPEAFRKCVGTYLPPLLAECSVPHHVRGLARIHQYKPVVHHNHTNANLLPNCLKRRMRELSRYLMKENLFTHQAGKIVKTVVMQNLIPSGGPNLLGLISQRYILALPGLPELVKFGAAQCLEAYNNSRALRERDFDLGERLFDDDLAETGSSDEDDSDEDDSDKEDEDGSVEDDSDKDGSDDNDLKEAVRSVQSDFLWEEEEDEDEESDEEEEEEKENIRQSHWRAGFSGQGNGLPYGGTNAIAEEMIYGKCVIDSLIKNNLAHHIIQIIGKDAFFYPIPHWWVEPLLRYYKKFREDLENSRSG